MELKQECIGALQQLNDDSKFNDSLFKEIITASVDSIVQQGDLKRLCNFYSNLC